MNYQQFHTCLRRKKRTTVQIKLQTTFLLVFQSDEEQKSPGKKRKTFHQLSHCRAIKMNEKKERNEKFAIHKKGGRKRNFKKFYFIFLAVKCEQLSENCIKQLKFYLLMGF